MKYICTGNIKCGEVDKEGVPKIYGAGEEFKGQKCLEDHQLERLVEIGALVSEKDYAKLLKKGEAGLKTMSIRLEELERENAELRGKLGISDSEDEEAEEDEKDLEDMTKAELLALAEQLGIEVAKSWSKEEMIEALSEEG